MAAKVTIVNRILQKGELAELRAALDFPCDKAVIERTLQELKVEGAGENGWAEVKWGNDALYYDRRHALNDIYVLNHLAQRLSTLSETEQAKLSVLVDRHIDPMYMWRDEDGANKLPETLESLINLTHNLDTEGFTAWEGLSNDQSLGRHVIDTGLSPLAEKIDQELLPYLNFEKIGQDYHHSLEGRFTKNHFVFGLPDREQLLTPYDGMSLLIEPPEQANQTFLEPEMEMGEM